MLYPAELRARDLSLAFCAGPDKDGHGAKIAWFIGCFCSQSKREDYMTKLLMRLTGFALVLAIGVSPVLADTLVLKNGERITGFFEGGSARIVKFRAADGVIKDYDILSVQTIQFGDEKTASNTASSAPTARATAPPSPTPSE